MSAWPWVLCPRNLTGESALEWQGPCEADRHGPCKGQREIIRKCKEHDIKMQIKHFMFEDKCHSLIVLFGFLTSTEFLLNVVLDQLGHVPWSLQDVFAQVCPGKTYTTCGTPEAWPKMPKILIIGNSNCPTFSEWFCWLLHCVCFAGSKDYFAPELIASKGLTANNLVPLVDSTIGIW